MWPAKCPQRTASDTARACVRGSRNDDLRDAVDASLSQLEANSRLYAGRAQTSTLHSAQTTDFPLTHLTDAQMEGLYDDGMVGRKDGQHVRDEMLVSAPYGKCCYCQLELAETLDHVAPKSKFPTLSIEPLNLVPCCWSCNHGMSATWGTGPHQENLHPYFLPSLGRWLFATVNQTSPATVTYSARPDPALPKLLRSRISHQFSTHGLGPRLAQHAVSELSGLAQTLPAIGDAQQVQQHLSEQCRQPFAIDANHFRGVLFEALSQDAWYCEGGYEKR